MHCPQALSQAVAQLYQSSLLSTIALLSPVRAPCPSKLGELGALLVQEEEGVGLVSQYLLDHWIRLYFRLSDLASAGAAGTAGAAPAP